MSSYVNFRTRLASIMEVLAEAAVTEINELVEDGYAVLRLEISRKQKENDALKKKLHMMEMRIARCFSPNMRAREDSIQVYGTSTGTSGESNFPTVDDLSCKQSSLSLRSDGETMAVNEDQSVVSDEMPRKSEKERSQAYRDRIKEDPLKYEERKKRDRERYLRKKERGVVKPVAELPKREQRKKRRQRRTYMKKYRERIKNAVEFAGIEEGPESLLVKEETREEDLPSRDSQKGLIISEERPVETDNDESPIMGTPTEAAVGTEEQHNNRHSVWKDSGLDTVIKAEPDDEAVKLQATAGRLNRLGSEFVLYERPGHMETFFPQQIIESDNRGPACCYATRTESESLSAHTQLQVSPTTVNDADKSLSSLGSCDGIDSVPFEVEAVACSSWDKETLSGPIYTQYRHKKDWVTETWQPENTNIFPTRARILPKDNTGGLKAKGSSTTRHAPSDEAGMTTHNRTGTRERRFICNFCGKSFTSPQNLQTHLRVHTGERPFSCAQCGKRFTQAGHLKTHQSVHTGDRPYLCAHCGKRFAGKQNLRIHQQRKHQANYNVM